jgi:hypothetical protein
MCYPSLLAQDSSILKALFLEVRGKERKSFPPRTFASLSAQTLSEDMGKSIHSS